MEKIYYIVRCNDMVFETASLLNALREAKSKCSSTITIYRASLIAMLEPSEIEELLSYRTMKGEENIPGKELVREEKKASRIAVVFDQMFKGFAEILEREVREPFIEFHEILGRGIDRTIRIKTRLYQQPARDDYDVMKLLEHLARKNARVIFFTGDKRLAAQARLLENVQVEYLPPSEVAGKEAAIKLMLRKINSAVKELENP